MAAIASPYPWVGLKSHLPWELRTREQISFHFSSLSGKSKGLGSYDDEYEAEYT